MRLLPLPVRQSFTGSLLCLALLPLLAASSSCTQAQCLRQSDCPPPSTCRVGRCIVRSFGNADGAVPESREIFDAGESTLLDAGAADGGSSTAP